MSLKTPGELTSFAKNGFILNNETAQLAKKELDQGVPFGTHLTIESIRSLKKQNKKPFWKHLQKFFSIQGHRH
jgi:hypothetical protein